MAHFTLRPFAPDDLPSLVKHANDPTVAAHLTDAFPHPYTEEHGRAFLENAINGASLRRCIAIEGECRSAIGLHPKTDLWRRNMELGYWLAASAATALNSGSSITPSRRAGSTVYAEVQVMAKGPRK